MSSIRSMLSNLRVSRNYVSGSEKNKYKFLRPNPNKIYKVRFYPFLDLEGIPQTIKNIWYHYYNDEKYLCNGFSCNLCNLKIKKSLQRLVNVSVLETDDQYIKENQNYILNLNYKVLDLIVKYEEENNINMFDLFGSVDLTLKPNEALGSNGMRLANFDDPSTVEFGKIILPISKELPNYSDDEVLDYIRNFVTNLDDVEKDEFKIYSSEKAISNNSPKIESLEKSEDNNIITSKQFSEDDEIQINVSKSFPNEKTISKPTQVKHKVTYQNEDVNEDDNNSSSEEKSEFVANFLNDLDD